MKGSQTGSKPRTIKIDGLLTRRVKKAVAKFLGKRGLNHQNVIRKDLRTDNNRWLGFENEENQKKCIKEARAMYTSLSLF